MHISTYTGRYINLGEFKTEDIDIRDISVSLSRIARYNGHSLTKWSVAQHMMLCGYIYHALFGKQGPVHHAVYIHDVEETWLQDILSPIKSTFMNDEYVKVRDDIDKKVYEFFNLTQTYEDNKELIHDIDMVALMVEKKSIYPGLNMSYSDLTPSQKEMFDSLGDDFVIDEEFLNMTEEEIIDLTFKILNVIHVEGVMGVEIKGE